MRWGLIMLCACHPASSIGEPSPFELPRYPGVTRCGPPAPPPTPERAAPLPAREPVMSYTPPSRDLAGRIEIDGDLSGSSGLSGESVSRVVQARAPLFRRCFYQLLAHDPRAGDFKVQLGFQIVDDGSVAGVEVHGLDPTMDACLCRAAADLRFRPFGRATVTYPLFFGSQM